MATSNSSMYVTSYRGFFFLPVDVCPALQSLFQIAGACFQSLKRGKKEIKLQLTDCDSIYITGFFLVSVTNSHEG